MSTLLTSVNGTEGLLPTPSIVGGLEGGRMTPSINHKITKKNRHDSKSSNKYKQDLWKQIDSSFINEDCECQPKQQTTASSEAVGAAGTALECVYRSSGQREHCDSCSSIVCLTDDGFLTCTNQNAELFTRTYWTMVQNGAIMAQMITSPATQRAAECR